MKEIKLRGKYGAGKFAIVDDDDFDWLNQWKWCINGGGYAVGSVFVKKRGRRWPVLMHRLILNTPDDMQADHKNNNKLDNRRENLRNCTNLQNMGNRPIGLNNTSGYKGVSWESKRNKWAVRIRINGKVTHVGRYVGKEEAAKAYDEAAVKIFGEFAILNFNA